jgi:hypothetical protein
MTNTCRGCSARIPAHKTWHSEACRSSYRRKRARAISPSGQGHLSRKEAVTRLEKLLAENDLQPEDIGSLKAVRINEWEGFIKNADGEVEKTTLRGASIILNPKWDTGPEWPVVQQAKPTVVPPHKPSKPRKGKWRTAVILPDPQIGYRQLTNGDLDPFHDEAAMRIAMNLVAEVQPDLIVNLGDLLDFASHGKYAQEPGFALTTQPTLDRAHRFLADQRATVPHAEIRLLEGNHDIRLANSIMANALAAFGLHRANLPDSWPVMSVPHLLRLDELGVEYIGGYPNGRTWINDRLACAHAPTKLRSNGSSAAASIDDERVSVIVGHTHRIELHHKTRNVRDGARQNFVAALGCLCRTDGAVPSTKSSLDPMGRPVTHYEDWQQAAGVVTYKEGDGAFGLEIVPILKGGTLFRGQELGG